jgi:hypothetical protein
MKNSKIQKWSDFGGFQKPKVRWKNSKRLPDFYIGFSVWHHEYRQLCKKFVLHIWYILHIVKDVVKHHFIHLSHHPSIHPSDHPFVLSWSVYSNGANKEWSTHATQWRIIYISVVNFYFYFYFGVFGLTYTHPVSFSTTERVGLGFFFVFEILFRILEIFNVFYIVIIFYYISMDARASSC